MPFVKCPECGKLNSIKLKNCPKCEASLDIARASYNNTHSMAAGAAGNPCHKSEYPMGTACAAIRTPTSEQSLGTTRAATCRTTSGQSMGTTHPATCRTASGQYLGAARRTESGACRPMSDMRQSHSIRRTFLRIVRHTDSAGRTPPRRHTDAQKPLLPLIYSNI